MADDIALHLARAGFDGVSACTQIAVGPKPFVDGVGIACHELPVRTENFLGDLLEALVELAPEYFLDGAFGAGDASGSDTAEGAHLVEAHDLNFRAALGEFLADDRIFGRGAPVALDGPRKFDEARDVALEDKVQARTVGPTLVHQGADRHVPAVIHFAEDIFNRNANIAEEQFVEFGFAGHLAERANFDARRFHVHEEDGESFVFRGGRVSANDEFAPVAHPSIAGPNFLAV